METHEQQAVVEWFLLRYPQHHLIAYPGGQWIAGSSSRGKFALIKKYKSEGWTNGVSDLFLCVMRGGFGGLWLEMKDIGKTKKSLSPNQKSWSKDMRAAGYMAKWAAGFEEAKNIIEQYMELPDIKSYLKVKT